MACSFKDATVQFKILDLPSFRYNVTCSVFSSDQQLPVINLFYGNISLHTLQVINNCLVHIKDQ
jgi:hypothetical protein